MTGVQTCALPIFWDVEKSVQVLHNAEQIDPLSPIPPAFLSFDYYMLRQYDKAVDVSNRSLQLNTSFLTEYTYMARIYLAMGNTRAADEALNKIPPEAADGMALSTRAIILASSGKRKEAQAMLAEMGKRSETQYISPFEFALVYIGLNDLDQAFVNLNKAYDDRSENLGFIRQMPYFDPIRNDPRYDELLRKIGFVQ